MDFFFNNLLQEHNKKRMKADFMRFWNSDYLMWGYGWRQVGEK
jgi:hypothetical protein